MQALIDFDGWRKWKDFADTSTANGNVKGKGKSTATGPNAAAKKALLSKTAAAQGGEVSVGE